VFIDFWNFQLNWNDRSRGAKCDWFKLPSALVARGAQTARLGHTQYEGTRVYASVAKSNHRDTKFKG